jgi:hypothetical protein
MNGNTRLLKIIGLIGLAFWTYLQFGMPSFSGDEIALGNNIKSKSLIKILYP